MSKPSTQYPNPVKFWNSLPESGEPPIAVSRAAAAIKRIEESQKELSALMVEIYNEASTDWTPTEIAQAMLESLKA